MFLDNAVLRKELEELNEINEDLFRAVFETLDHMLVVESKPKKKIGFPKKISSGKLEWRQSQMRG
ncbi:MAG: hypothetical protein KKC46_10530 [Proteobacteria bacterium]|nr:hypothetical protein [Pseudomonadota bacterium]